jgi:hypothetical protein
MAHQASAKLSPKYAAHAPLFDLLRNPCLLLAAQQSSVLPALPAR